MELRALNGLGLALTEVLDLMEQQFITAAQNDLMTRIASGEIETKEMTCH
ncbi:hypothetical protein MRS76_21940 [Rhizobiaceae bacterium n13]|uniref:Uncharacterized protein n=1 Tax=Ferirhizobium litorale TaxID=2927786 RepID=A0AAE3QJV7_9HYPH|nr:hypothetical protein [Fererhizobium litorale]MDI7864599.1 hypothetical protein [Fererhizobium litorale]MDI7924860.1 hypothetical protein [Fererhizobium litorale]